MCPVHGEYTKYAQQGPLSGRVIWTRCQACIESEQQALQLVEARAEVARREAMLDDSGIPRRFLDRSFDNFVATSKAQQQVLATTKAYVEEFDRNFEQGFGLVFSGKLGTGKTHLAAAILSALMPGYVGRYTTAMDLIQAIRSTWRRDSVRSERDVLNRIAGFPMLVIDEVGVQYGTDGEQTLLFDVLDRRYREMIPTILITNQPASGLREFIGDRSFDRLRECSHWVQFDWDSYRPEAARSAKCANGTGAKP